MSYMVILLSIIMVNLLLSGDNALVIALASRQLPKAQQHQAVLWGGVGAIGLRIILTFIAILLLRIPYLQLLGGLLLLWVAIKLGGQEHDHEEHIQSARTFWGALRTIIMADLVMSLDNVLALAGVAKGNTVLLVIGLIISIPIIMWGSKFIMRVMERWPVIIVLGAAFLGWTAGEMVLADEQLLPYVQAYSWLEWAVPAAFAAAVVIVNFGQRQQMQI